MLRISAFHLESNKIGSSLQGKTRVRQDIWDEKENIGEEEALFHRAPGPPFIRFPKNENWISQDKIFIRPFPILSLQDDSNSVMSFSSSLHSVQDSALQGGGGAGNSRQEVARGRRLEHIDSKIEGVNSLIGLQGCNDVEKMSKTFEALSSTASNCELMRSRRVIPILVQFLHGSHLAAEAEVKGQIARGGQQRCGRSVRRRAAKALQNMVNTPCSHPTEKHGRKKEARILKLLVTLRLYADLLRDMALAFESGYPEADRQKLLEHGCRSIRVKSRSSSSSSRQRLAQPEEDGEEEEEFLVCGE